MTMPLSIGIVLMVIGVILGILICIIAVMRDKKREILDKEERLEIIEEVFSEYGDCEHDAEGPSADYDGHHFISYSIDKKGREKILEAL